ncbi:MAG TPA: glutamate formimidoyltransferase [Bacteroidales bacterium]|jgi:glutamate formiminotransferase/formiminotetrahydrofolate cyclodeaminase|nr:glutamate formimidoyltransferase [Bacteroidales bacterium]
MKQLIECVPNFSEGRNLEIIKQITDEIEKSEGVMLLDVDPGFSTNRTVVTFVGTPDEVVETAFKVIKKAQELIDMRHHSGDHPRFGATDVCPLVPVSNITMEETVVYARKLAEKVGKELHIPVFCYEYAAFTEVRRNLANVRAGEYEKLKERIASDLWKPDFGPSQFDDRVAKSGATAIGARDFLIAVNFNLNTTSTRRANAIAFDVREKGRAKREGHPITGKILKDKDGNTVMIPGTLKGTKAIGWFIKEYGIAQVSMNITDSKQTPLHVAFEEISAKAAARGVRVTGAEIVGLVPKKTLIDAGRYYLAKQQRSLGIEDAEIIKIAVKSMGLDDLKPFNPEEKVIEYLLAKSETSDKLMDLSCHAFANETASESPAPGGGSVSAYVGALGVALGTMVANLSAHKPGWDERWEEFSRWAEKGQQIKEELLWLVEEDTRAFNKIIEAFGLPSGSEQEKIEKNRAIQDATQYAIDIPYKTLLASFKIFELCEAMVKTGNPNSISDAGVGALCARASMRGAYLNMKINATSLEDKKLSKQLLAEAEEYLKKAEKIEATLMEEVMKIIEK